MRRLSSGSIRNARTFLLIIAVAAQMQDPVSLAELQAVGSVETLLGLLQLSQYAPWFREQDVDKGVFISLLESDLVEMQVGGSA